MITKDQLKKIVPFIKKQNLDIYLPLLNELLPKYQIVTKERICCFIAQVAHESGSFNYVEEIADGSAYDVGKLAQNLGNTPEDDGDGEFFKGRGLIQITGRTNYLACSKALFNDDRLLKNPEILEQPRYALESALWFWNSRSLNSIADKDDSYVRIFRGKKYNKFQWITLRINGGQNGYADRLNYYKRAKSAINEL